MPESRGGGSSGGDGQPSSAWGRMEGADEEEEEEEQDSSGRSPDRDVDPSMDRPGLGQGPGLGLGLPLWSKLGLEPGARRSTFLLGAPFPPSCVGVLTTTSLSTRPESNLCSGCEEQEEQ